MNETLITVVIPTYNHAAFLGEALDSLLTQTWQNWEAIIVNNFSTDDTEAVVESCSDPRIRLENFCNHGVIAASRNHAIALARGEYIAFLDSDDLWLPEKLQRCMTAFVPDIDLVCHDLRWFGDRTGNLYCGPAEKASFEALLLEGSCITPSATIVRSKLLRELGGFSEDPAIISAEDYHLWLKLAEHGAKMMFLREILGNYRVHGSNQSGSALRHMNAVRQVVSEYSRKPKAIKLIGSQKMRRRQCLIAYGAARTMQRAGEYHNAWPLLRQAIAWYPLHLKSWIAILINSWTLLSNFLQARAECIF